MQDKNDFFERVHEVAKLIPDGRVTTYGAIAEYLGAKKASRSVGFAMNASHGKNIPAHRVVNRNGQLTGKGHFAYPDLMQELLEKEGHVIMDNTIKGFEEVLWKPLEELL